jgi:hypothetical protein
MILRMDKSCHNQRIKVSKYPLPTFINEGEASSTRDRALVLDACVVFPCWSWLPLNPRKDRVRYGYKDIGCWIGIAEAHGITNGSSQGVESQDDPFVLDRCFPARFTTLKGRKMLSTNPPHLSSDGKRHEKGC